MSDDIQVFVKDTNSKQKTIKISQKAHLSNLKYEIENTFEKTFERLVFGGVNLDDSKNDKTLEELGIKEFSSIQGIIRLRGGQ